MKKLLKKPGKKFIAIIVAMLLVFPGFALAGCEKKSNKIVIDVYSQLANYAGIQKGWFGKVIEDRFGVQLNIIPTDDGIFATRAASGDLGDLILFGGNSSEYVESIEGGLLMEWSDELLDNYGPWIKYNMSAALEHNKTAFGGGTKIYGFAHDVSSSPELLGSYDYHPDLRFDLYQQIDEELQQIDTLEDYLPALKAMQDLADEDGTYGLSLFSDWDGNSVMFVKALGALYGYDEFGFSHYDTTTKAVKPYLPTDNTVVTADNINNYMYLRCLKFYYEANQLGILNPNSNTQKFDDVSNSYTNGKTLFALFSWLGANAYNNPTRLSEGKGMFAVPAADAKNIIYQSSVYGGDRMWAIGSKCERPELVMEIINWLCTPEGVMTYQHGPRGLTWDYKEVEGKTVAYVLDEGREYLTDNNKIVPDEFGGGKYGDGSYKMNNTTFSLNSINPNTGERYNRDYWTTEINRNVSEAEKDWRDFYGVSTVDELLETKHSVSINCGYSMKPYGAELQLKADNVKNAIKTKSWLAIYAKDDAEFYSIVNDMIGQAKEAGYNDLAAFDQAEGTTRKNLEIAYAEKFF